MPTILPALVLAFGALAQPNQPSAEFPGKSWKYAARPEDLGWSSEKLEAARAYGDSVGSAAVFIVHHGEVVSQWGATTNRLCCFGKRA